MKKNWLVFLMMFLMVPMVYAQESSHQLSSHILDISTGKPAPHVKIALQKRDAQNNWVWVEEKITDQNGRVKDFLKQEGKNNTGIYKLTFYTAPDDTLSPASPKIKHR